LVNICSVCLFDVHTVCMKDVKQSIRNDMDSIYVLVEGISLFDMLMSFATLASISKGYSRPIFEQASFAIW